MDESAVSGENVGEPDTVDGTPERGSILIAGGGTAGHVLPGLAVADELVERGHPRTSIHFVGSARGPEADLVSAGGYGLTLLPGRGIQRKLTIANLRSTWDLLRGIGTALRLVRRSRPSVVLILGGYASFAAALAAIVCRAPLVVADQNARAGAVNRLAAPFARASAVPFESTDLPHKVVVGNPVRPEIRQRAANRDAGRARDALGLPLDGTLLAVFAGSLGARRINSAVRDALEGPWSERSDLVIHHVLGARDWELYENGQGVRTQGVRTDGVGEGSAGPSVSAGPHYNPVRYEENMDLLLDAADLAVCRAGGTTVAELAVMGTPAILVPLPIATRDHQRANAMELTGIGAAVIVDDGQFDDSRLVAEVAKIVDDPDRLSSMADAARSFARPDAASRLADLLEENAR